MFVDFHSTVRNFVACMRSCDSLRLHNRFTKTFLALISMEFVVDNILEELMTSPRSRKYFLVISDHFVKLLFTVPLRAVTVEYLSKPFAAHWVGFYGPPCKHLSDTNNSFLHDFLASLLNPEKCECVYINVSPADQYSSQAVQWLCYLGDLPICWPEPPK